MSYHKSNPYSMSTFRRKNADRIKEISLLLESKILWCLKGM